MTPALVESASAATKTGAGAGASAISASLGDDHTMAATTPTDNNPATDARRRDFHQGSFATLAETSGLITEEASGATLLGTSFPSCCCTDFQKAISPDGAITASPRTTALVAWCAVHHAWASGSDSKASNNAPSSSAGNSPSAKADSCACSVEEVSVICAIPSYQRLPVCLSNRGFTLAEMASRARKIRDRTVPIGQAMVKAISS